MDAEFRDRAAFVDGTLVLADLHIGKHHASGVEFPLGEASDLHERLRALCEYFPTEEVVFAGDILHSFQTVPDGVEETVRLLFETVTECGAAPVIVRGNHDVMLDAVCDRPIYDEYELDGGDLVITHGHAEPSTRARQYVVGHDHPSIRIEGQKRPCYLYGPATYEGGDVLLLPAFNRLVAGVTINQMDASNFHSPMVTDADALQPIVYDQDADETLRFPHLGQFRGML
jgi:hypothetical protein